MGSLYKPSRKPPNHGFQFPGVPPIHPFSSGKASAVHPATRGQLGPPKGAEFFWMGGMVETSLVLRTNLSFFLSLSLSLSFVEDRQWTFNESHRLVQNSRFLDPYSIRWFSTSPSPWIGYEGNNSVVQNETRRAAQGAQLQANLAIGPRYMIFHTWGERTSTIAIFDVNSRVRGFWSTAVWMMFV